MCLWTTTWMVARTASRHRAVRSCSKSACVGTMRSVPSAWRDRFGLFTEGLVGLATRRFARLSSSANRRASTQLYTTIGTRPHRGAHAAAWRSSILALDRRCRHGAGDLETRTGRSSRSPRCWATISVASCRCLLRIARGALAVQDTVHPSSHRIACRWRHAPRGQADTDHER